MALVSTYVTQVKDECGITNTNFDTFFLNSFIRAYKEVRRLLINSNRDWILARTNLDIATDDTYVSIASVSPDVLVVRALMFKDAGGQFWPVARDASIMEYVDAQLVSGNIITKYWLEGQLLYIYPKANFARTAALRLTYIGDLATITTATEVTDELPVNMDDSLVPSMCRDYFLRTKQFQSAGFYQGIVRDKNEAIRKFASRRYRDKPDINELRFGVI